ncbi:MAG: hypothetical protein G01um101418_19 [Parcubacteria group bacterium Gr01-1014_18]|nr:MAG: hypothetical protein Greene041636_19 [Parcubacteria group bacterium Greene0416_36]TSC81525.1 MAG: hypothetical protein G01um101418_19 [Parcubacteria group bacterium Gr01-1014_18]TSC99664.1 MAG: hypothetical protein Greene101420_68 [Parcubacteria group bacterium Greene1014_20]TSD07115.1 MAG: hypothetical protein Greene07142_427 [Parcubacteria group bacterium Greene0714_2]
MPILFKYSLLLSPLVFLSGCTLPGAVTVTDGGVFRSTDRASTWEPRIFVDTVKNKPVTIANTTILDMEFDPKNPDILFVGTGNKGGFKSSNAGEKWEAFGPREGALNLIAISPKNSDEMYIARGNSVFKTTDGGKNFSNIYAESRGVAITSLELDLLDSNRIYMGLADGALIRSTNGGVSWSIIKSAENRIEKIVIDPRDSKKIYVFTQSKGIFKSIDFGANWIEIRSVLSERFTDSLIFKDALLDPSRSDTIYYASKYGILKSTNGAADWDALALLTPPGSIEIFSLAVDPKNPKVIYYTTPGKIYISVDGAQTWSIKSLPTSQSVKVLRADPRLGDTLYLGAGGAISAGKSNNTFGF